MSPTPSLHLHMCLACTLATALDVSHAMPAANVPSRGQGAVLSKDHASADLSRIYEAQQNPAGSRAFSTYLLLLVCLLACLGCCTLQLFLCDSA